MTSYTPPSQCDRCVPEVTESEYITHYAHQAECANAPERTTR